MRRRKRDNSSPDDDSNWMTTYSDLVTLLLTFFVLLFSMATIEEKKFQELSRSLQNTFLNMSNKGEVIDIGSRGKDLELLEGEELVNIIEEMNNSKGDSDIPDDEDESGRWVEIIEAANWLIEERTEQMKEQIRQSISELGLSDLVTVVREEHNVVLRVDSLILFDLGKAEIKDSGKEVLNVLSKLISETENEVLIQGHTDDLPINTLLYPTNWELSTKRATNVVLYLTENCGIVPEKLTATGNGEYRPIASNDTPEERQKNRRIDIVLAQNYFNILDK